MHPKRLLLFDRLFHLRSVVGDYFLSFTSTSSFRFILFGEFSNLRLFSTTFLLQFCFVQLLSLGFVLHAYVLEVLDLL